MLTNTTERGGAHAAAALARGRNAADAKPSRLARLLRVEWLGQTAASLCWIASVFAYGVTSTGDWLQLCAASAWFLANVAAALGEDG